LRKLRGAIRALTLWFTALAAVAIGVLIVLSSNPFKQCVYGGQHDSAKQQLNDYVTLRDNLLVYRDCLGEFVHANGDAIIAAFTVILAFSTIALWSATRGLVRSAENTAERQLRAYVSYKGGDFIHIDIADFDANKIPQCDLVLINQGQTPAKNVTISRRTWVTADPESLLVAPVEERAREGSVKFFAPGAEIPVTAKLSRKLEAAEFEYMKIGRIVLRAAFHITYDDVFGQPHFYKFGRAATMGTAHGLIYTEQWDGQAEDEDSD
jgi:hypothetical protein